LYLGDLDLGRRILPKAFCAWGNLVSGMCLVLQLPRRRSPCKRNVSYGALLAYYLSWVFGFKQGAPDSALIAVEHGLNVA
jgi:hypothetical protein